MKRREFRYHEEELQNHLVKLAEDNKMLEVRWRSEMQKSNALERRLNEAQAQIKVLELQLKGVPEEWAHGWQG